MNDFHALLNLIVSLSEKQGNPITKKEVFDELFLFSNVSGGHYHIPEGEKIVRIVIADQLKKICQQNIPINNIIETSGASHGIATLFKLCTHPNIDFLSEGDTVLSISPNYSPYNDLFRQFKLDVQPLVIDSETGEVQIDNVIDITKKIKMISMIDPNNPTGHMIQPEQLKKIAELARKLDAIILTDEIYAEFFLERRTSIIDFAPERTLLLGGASKIQRSTGLRLGYFAFTDACADYLTKKILNGVGDIRKSLINAKAPG
jgi:aminotransferase